METLQNAPARHGQAATKHPLVSVVMPAYNAEKYIGEAIRSVQSQTYANWILLVIRNFCNMPQKTSWHLP